MKDSARTSMKVMQSVDTNDEAYSDDAGVTLKMSQFKWGTLPRELANVGAIISNYPTNCRLPGAGEGSDARSKGISELTLNERRMMAQSLSQETKGKKMIFHKYNGNIQGK
jgi:hypothetical protein